MKLVIQKLIAKVAEVAAQSFSLAKKDGSFNVLEIAELKAALESAEYYETHLIKARTFSTNLALLDHAADLINQSGLIMEFGVASGKTISRIAGRTRSTVYGFDSFEGLPEAWRSGFDKGAFAGDLPPVPENVKLIKGWFSETLPDFLMAHPEPVTFLHIDCDLYSSTKTIFDLLAPRLNPGCVIVFDEYWNYPGWKQHEQKAFFEFLKQTGMQYRYDSFVPSHQQVCVVLN